MLKGNVLRTMAALACAGVAFGQDRVVLIPTGADQWRYYPLAAAPQPGWHELEFDDALWTAGTAELGFGDGDEVTPLVLVRTELRPPRTVYFRRRFDVPRTVDLDGASFVLSLRRDDGAVVYINGHEVCRSNMPPGPVDWNTLATSVVHGAAAEQRYHRVTLENGAFEHGANLVAVEVHQADDTSSDISFDLGLEARAERLIAFQNGIAPTAAYASAADSYLDVEAPDQRQGTATRLQVDGAPVQKAFLRWELDPDLDADELLGAVLHLEVADPSRDTYTVYGMDEPWDATALTARWRRRLEPWTRPAGPVPDDLTVIATLTAPRVGPCRIELNAAGVALVRRWLADRDDNCGIMIAAAGHAQDGFDLCSSEYPTPARRPRLELILKPARRRPLPAAAAAPNAPAPAD